MALALERGQSRSEEVIRAGVPEDIPTWMITLTSAAIELTNHPPEPDFLERPVRCVAQHGEAEGARRLIGRPTLTCAAQKEGNHE